MFYMQPTVIARGVLEPEDKMTNGGSPGQDRRIVLFRTVALRVPLSREWNKYMRKRKIGSQPARVQHGVRLFIYVYSRFYLVPSF